MRRVLDVRDSLSRCVRQVALFYPFLWLVFVNPVRGQQEDSTFFERRLPPDLVSQWVVNPFDPLPFRSVFSMDSVASLRGLIDVRFEESEEWMEISSDGRWISFYEATDDLYMKTPFTAPMEWYFRKRLMRNRIRNIYSQRGAVLSDATAQAKAARGGAITLDLMETGVGQASLTVKGNVSISGKLVFQDQEMARASFRESQTTHFEFDETQHVMVEGKVGERVSVLLDYNSERDFQWENNIKIKYTGHEDEIVQKIEAGNIALSLPSTQFVTFSGSNQGLFGLKSISRLGPVDVTAIASIERTKKEKQKIMGGAETQGQTIPDYQMRKNQYFFIDKVFRDGGLVVDNEGIALYTAEGTPLFAPSFYPLKDGKHRIGTVVIDEIEIFKSVGAAAGSGTLYGFAYVNPYIDSTDSTWQEKNPAHAGETEGSFFQRLVRNQDYVVSEDLGFVRLTAPVQNEILAVSYTLAQRGEEGSLRSVGELSTEVAEGDTIHLKLIKPLTPNPGHPTWPLAFKNVYYMGASNITPEGFELQIVYKNGRLGNNERDENSGLTFIHLFGLDSLNENGANIADDLVDRVNPNIINMSTGELFFPMLHPFEMDRLAAGEQYRGEGNRNAQLESILPDSAYLYRSLNEQKIRNSSKFDIKISYQNKGTTVNLGGFMLVEGSEEVYLNKQLLARDKDYIIDYFTGTLTFLTDEYEKPDAELEVFFDKHEIVSFDKKTMIGTRAQMDLGPRSFIGGTALFYDQSVINEKIEVGYEPTKNFIWDLNGRYEADVDFATRALDKLPLIETNKPSSFKIEGEFAQVLPNPNPVDNLATGDDDGVAYIDDFEGSKRTTSPSVRRRFWHRSSTPLGFRQENRANMFWYNPWTQVRTQDIWPNQQTSTFAQNQMTDVLAMNYTRREAHLGTVDPDSNWASVTASLYSSDYNQSQNKFFEIWLKTASDIDGKMSVDLGFISEDQNGNGMFDTEDKPEAGLLTGNTLLEKEEDVGLDGCEDAYENGLGGCLDTLYANVVDNPDWQDKLYAGFDRNLDDPNGDNWDFDEQQALTGDRSGNPEPYRSVNGTEQNGYPVSGQVPLEGGRYPDTEDINRDGNFDGKDDYFSASFELNPYSEDWERYNGGTTETGWRLYRVPLNEFRRAKENGAISWDTIKFMRLSLSGVQDETVVRIAKVEIVGNEWQELGVRSDLSQEYTRDDSVFAVTVVNTEDNLDYAQSVEEIGVQGEYDRINQIRMKEQSLVLKFADLEPGHEAAAQKNLIELQGNRVQSYLMYKQLKLFTYGNSDHTWKDSSDVEFLIRFGRADDYYEISQPVYEGWDKQEKRNYLKVDLDFLTGLKLKEPGPNLTVTDNERHYFETDDSDTLRQYLIHGNPALSRIQYFVVGVRNKSRSENVSGEIWLDELRLSKVRKDKGTAIRIQSSLGLADVGNASLSYTRRDADFHVLQERLGSGSTAGKLRFDTRLNINKLFPQSWGLQLPLSMSFTNNLTTPKYLPGTDILLAHESPPDSVLAKSRQVTVNTSFSKAGKSDKWFSRYTLDRLKMSLSATRGRNSDTQIADRFSQNTKGNMSYGLSFGRDNYISPFKWFKSVPWLGKKIVDGRLYYTPSSIDMSANASETMTETMPRVGESKSQYNLGLNRTFKMGYTILDNLKSSFTKTIKSDMDSWRARYLQALKNLKPGVVTDVTDNMTTTFTPALSEWLRPTFNYSSNYRWAKPMESTQEGANITSQGRFSSSVSITPKSIVETFYTPPKSQPRRRSRRGGRTKVAPPEKEKEAKEPESETLKKIFKILHDGASRINPISFTYSVNRSQNAFGVIDSVRSGDSLKVVPGTADLSYRFGFSDELGLNRSSEVGVNRGSVQHQRDFSLRSGLALSRKISTNFNFSSSQASGVDGNNVETRTQTRDFLPLGVTGSDGLPFAGWSVRWTGVEQWPLIKAISRSATLEHAFAGKETRAWKDDVLQSSKYTASYSPLAGLSMTLLKGVSATTRYSIVSSFDNKFGGINSTRVKTDRTWTLSSNYAHRGGLHIPIFFFRDFDLDNTINFTLTIDFSESITKERNDLQYELSTTDERKSWKVSPRISYSFSQRMTGGVWYEYRESHSKIIGKKVDRDFGFDINLALQG